LLLLSAGIDTCPEVSVPAMMRAFCFICAYKDVDGKVINSKMVILVSIST
jgi:hypothetical protein